MAIYFTPSLIILSFSMSLVLLSASPTLNLNLIHPNQIYSLEPPHVYRIDEASFARLDYLEAKATGDIIAKLSPNMANTFVVNISIGSPPIMQLLDMDTGSDLLWIQCRPCTNCYSQSLPIFDSAKSDTYQKESCKATGYYMPSLRFNPTTRSCDYSTLLSKETFIAQQSYNIGYDLKAMKVSFERIDCGVSLIID